MCSKATQRQLLGCPHENETNHSKLDYMSDWTVRVGIVFMRDAAAQLRAEGCVS